MVPTQQMKASEQGRCSQARGQVSTAKSSQHVFPAQLLHGPIVCPALPQFHHLASLSCSLYKPCQWSSLSQVRCRCRCPASQKATASCRQSLPRESFCDSGQRSDFQQERLPNTGRNEFHYGLNTHTSRSICFDSVVYIPRRRVESDDGNWKRSGRKRRQQRRQSTGLYDILARVITACMMG